MTAQPLPDVLERAADSVEAIFGVLADSAAEMAGDERDLFVELVKHVPGKTFDALIRDAGLDGPADLQRLTRRMFVAIAPRWNGGAVRIERRRSTSGVAQ